MVIIMIFKGHKTIPISKDITIADFNNFCIENEYPIIGFHTPSCVSDTEIILMEVFEK